MKIELPTSASSPAPKRRNYALLLLGIGSLLLATTCSFYVFSQSQSPLSDFNGASRELFSKDYLTTTTTSAGTCANGKRALVTGLTLAEKTELLRAHNIYRSMIAQGKAQGQPGAIDMLEMIWDDQVALRAQAWANNCVFQHDDAANRQPTKFKYVGQNLIYSSYSSSKQVGNFTQMVEQFYNEFKLYGGYSAPVSSYQYNAKTGHYTQLAWANSYTLGCGFKKYLDGSWYTYLLVCNYGPGGNYLRQKMYTKGTFNAKNCKKGASTKYKALCKAV
jgi:hypothetical protein